MAEEWGWVRYKRTYRQRADGAKLYIGYFKQDDDPDGWTTITVEFWAHRPVIALRTICNSGKDPGVFSGQTIN